MTKIFKNKSKVLFVSKADRVLQRGKYTIILSPEFYWVKRVTLPVKSERDALKLAPSIYDGFLPAGDFSYEVRKSGDEFIMIAYDKKEISQSLDKIFLHRKDVVDVYFAQDALSHIGECVAVDNAVALSNMSGTIIQIPRVCTKTDKTLNDVLEGASLAKRKVKLSSFDNALLSTGDIKLIASLFSLLFLAFASEYFVYKKALHELENQRAEIIKEHKLPRTSIQLKSIKKSLHKKFTTQKDMREVLYAISKISLKSGEYIESIEQTTKGATVKIHISEKTREDAIKKMFPATIMIKESSVRENILELRITS